jgi:hypothetical protein
MPCFPRKLLGLLQKVKESLGDLVQMDSCAHYVNEAEKHWSKGSCQETCPRHRDMIWREVSVLIFGATGRRRRDAEGAD